MEAIQRGDGAKAGAAATAERIDALKLAELERRIESLVESEER